MNNEKKYIGVYYPDAVIENPRTLATFCLFFDEIHLVTMADLAKDPTNYLKSLPDKFYINTFGGVSQELIDRTNQFYKFALNNRELIGEVIFYHPHLFDSHVTDLSKKLLSGGLPTEDLFNFITGESDKMQPINEFRDKFPHIKDEIVLRTAPTALKLSQTHNYILLSDSNELPIPTFSRQDKNVANLTSILAEECINIALPTCIDMTPEELLEAREKLKDQLAPFRMAMQKLSSSLKVSVENMVDIKEIKSEAKFIAESQVEPALYELQKRIDIENDKFGIRIFGKAFNWIPLVANSFMAPSPDNIYKTFSKVYGDAGDIIDGALNVNIAREPGLSFLFKIKEITEK